jgi:CheY-like chemotaxis protein
MVLTSMHLEHLSGEQLGRELRARHETSDTCIALMTHVGARGDARRLKAIGFSGYFMKPIPPEHLGELLRAVLATMTLSDEQRATQGLVTRYYVRDRQPEQLHVLVVEDDPVSLEMTSNRLERLGCDVTAVTTASECLDAVSRQSFTLVLLDQNLPDMRGDEVVERMPRVSVNTAPPVVMFSAGLTQAEKQRCRMAGVEGFLIKPASREGLRDTLRRYGWEPGPDTDADEEDEALPGLKAAFARESRNRLEELEAALSGSIDRDCIHRIAHTMRSATRHVGEERLAEAFDLLEERAARASDKELRDSGESLLDDWRSALADILADIEQPHDQTVRLAPGRSR